MEGLFINKSLPFLQILLNWPLRHDETPRCLHAVQSAGIGQLYLADLE